MLRTQGKPPHLLCNLLLQQEEHGKLKYHKLNALVEAEPIQTVTNSLQVYQDLLHY